MGRNRRRILYFGAGNHPGRMRLAAPFGVRLRSRVLPLLCPSFLVRRFLAYYVDVGLVRATSRHVELDVTERVPLGRDRVEHALGPHWCVVGGAARRILADHVVAAGHDADAVL